MTVARAAGIAAWTAAAFCATPSAAADYESAPHPRAAYVASGPASACADPGVLRFITGRFEYKAANYIRRNLSIYEIGQIQLSRYEPFNSYMSSVQREYCVAAATLTDGSRRPLLYVIETPWGFAGVGRNIEFCIPGLDPWYVYGDSCSSLR
ncbi:hypothetical protein SAMN05892877_106148 [Rhizobium subbaraonis]|uniref:Uncharacterized protein n=1 Tax=Rhizobium subbaraonis TaxID=908946 RepID=A0A285UE83_9HYPH|nr:hypothetical protein [Rhizobium subbaraonis]SOC39698.1 hypothetical protein SAMN05892877_106148 [Rhizobium subbaraonis]